MSSTSNGAGGKRRLTLSLIAHTNVGKTTLARTLLRRDVGQVVDQAHVTEVSEAFPLIETEDAQLFLWDTPGLGDTVRLVRRLRKEGSPVGWFLHQVWDRQRDRPLWCSQEALRNVREDADVVLYLVNAGEAPEDAGYVPLELEVLAWLGRPTLVVLNQTGGTGEAAERLVAEWRDFLAAQPAAREVVRDVAPLDAFTRSWLQEDALLERVVDLFEGADRAAMRGLADAWRARSQARFEDTLRDLSSFLVSAAADAESLPPERERTTAQARAAAEALLGRVAAAESSLWAHAIERHGLEGQMASEALGLLDALAPGVESLGLAEQVQQLFDDHRNTMKGAAGGGLSIGLAADLLSGGLTLGGGALVGAFLGGAVGRAVDRLRGREESRSRNEVRLSPELLRGLTSDAVCRYLLLAHFGRGRGDLEDAAEAARWRLQAQRALAGEEGALRELLVRASQGEPVAPELTALLTRALGSVLRADPGRT